MHRPLIRAAMVTLLFVLVVSSLLPVSAAPSPPHLTLNQLYRISPTIVLSRLIIIPLIITILSRL